MEEEKTADRPDRLLKKICGGKLQNSLKVALREQEKYQLFEKLPEEISIHVFKFLPIVDRIRIEKVCKSWQELAKQSWHNIKELKANPKFFGLKPRWYRYPKIDNVMLEAILKRCGKYLEKINVESPNVYDGSYECPLSIIAEYCPNLHSITCNKFSVPGFEKLSEMCQKLFEISITSEILKELNFEEILGNLISKNKKLRILNIPKFIGNGAFLLKLPFEEITTIKIGQTYNNHNLIDAIKKSKNLSTFLYEDMNIIGEIASSCANLTELDLKWYGYIDNIDSMFSEIFKNNKKMKIVKISY